jgi:hypothetical protein
MLYVMRGIPGEIIIPKTNLKNFKDTEEQMEY